MRLEDFKDQIDDYFDNVDANELVERFISYGYKFHEINSSYENGDISGVEDYVVGTQCDIILKDIPMYDVPEKINIIEVSCGENVYNEAA